MPNNDGPTQEEILAVNKVAKQYGVNVDIMHIALATVCPMIEQRVKAQVNLN